MNFYQDMIAKYPDLKEQVDRLKRSKEAEILEPTSMRDMEDPTGKFATQLSDSEMPSTFVVAPESTPKRPDSGFLPEQAGPSRPSPIADFLGNREQIDLKPSEFAGAGDKALAQLPPKQDIVSLAKEMALSKKLPEESFTAKPAMMVPPLIEPKAQQLELDTNDTLGTVENLREAQDKANEIRSMAGYAQAFDRIGSGIAGRKPTDPQHFKDMEKDAALPEQQLEALVQQEKKDPKSGISKGFTSYLKQFGVDIKGGISAEVAATMLPTIYKQYEDKIKLAHDEKIKGMEIASKEKIESEKGNLKKSIAQIVADNKKGAKENEFTKTRERETAKRLTKWSLGENKMIRSDIDKLKEVEAKLEAAVKQGKGNYTGPIKGNIPGQSIFNPAGQELANSVGSVTQKNLREILGGQFAQKEGEQLLKRAYEPGKDEKYNLERIRQLRTAMEQAADAKDEQLAYLEEHEGNMKGFRTVAKEKTMDDEFKDLGFEADE